MDEDSTAFDSKTMESIVVEDASLNQSEVSFKPNSSRDPGCRPTPVMVPVVFEKESRHLTRMKVRLVLQTQGFLVRLRRFPKFIQ